MSFLTRKEEIIMIAIWKLGGNAYGVSIREKVIELSRQKIVYGTLYNSLEYLIRKGFVSSKKGCPAPERGGKSKTIYSITQEGEIAIQKTRELQEQIWQDMPKFKLGTSGK
jgi:DNA-binding PadR family transcriptional regulator